LEGALGEGRARRGETVIVVKKSMSMSITFGVWASMVKPAKISAQRRKMGNFRGVL